jgi:hypothetical protein
MADRILERWSVVGGTVGHLDPAGELTVVPNWYRFPSLDSPVLEKHLIKGWAQRDSNPRHLPCKGSALAN